MNKKEFIEKYLNSEEIDTSTILHYHGIINLLSEIYEQEQIGNVPKHRMHEESQGI